MSLIWQIVAGLLPSIGVGWLFYKVMKAIIEGDRNERLAQSRYEAAQDAAAGIDKPHAESADAR